MKKCIVLCSSGIDSTSCLYWAKNNYEKVVALFIDYGQRNPFESLAIEKIVQDVGVSLERIRIDLRQIGGSALTDDIKVPKGRSHTEISHGVPITWVPNRNLIFLTLAGALACTLRILDIVIAVNVFDASGYPDCRPIFIKSAQDTLSFALDREMKIVTPVIKMYKSEIIRFGLANGADFSYTVSCYEKGIPCGIPEDSFRMSVKEIQEQIKGCDSCQLRAKGFNEANILDHLLVRLRKERKI